MLDLLSTRPGSSPQDTACARLLACVIAEAVRDACEPLRADERQAGKNYNVAARMALRFLFDPEGNPFSAYARLIGLDAASIRRGLLTPGEGVDRGPFTDAHRRTLRARFDMTDYATL